MKKRSIDSSCCRSTGIAAGRCVLWAVVSAYVRRICRRRCETWEESKLYILEPFEKRGEMDQGILRCSASYSLMRVAQGLPARRSLIGTPLGFLLGRVADAARGCSIR